MQAAQASQSNEKAVEKATLGASSSAQVYHLKEKGVVVDDVRGLVHDLVQLGVPLANVNNACACCCRTSGGYC